MTKWQKYRKIQNGESTGVRVCPCKYVEYIWRCLGTAKKWQKNPLWSSNYRTTYTNYRMMTTFGVSSKCRIATKKQQQHQNHAVRYSIHEEVAPVAQCRFPRCPWTHQRKPGLSLGVEQVKPFQSTGGRKPSPLWFSSLAGHLSTWPKLDAIRAACNFFTRR